MPQTASFIHDGPADFAVGAVQPLPVRPLTAAPLEAPGLVVAATLDQQERELVDEVAGVLGDSVLDEVGGYRLPADFCLSVVIPVYNEQATIREILRRVQAVNIPKEIIVVDDASTDGTRAVLNELAGTQGLRLFFHQHNQGKGAALRTGLAQALGDVVVVQDADLEYNPQEYPQLVRPIIEGQAEVVYGSRFLAGAATRQLLRHRLANGLLTWLSNRFTGLRLTDMETCHKVFRREALAGIEITQNRFGVEPELTAKIARRGHRVVEVPIAYHGRSVAEGKKIGLKDAFNALYCIARYSCAD